MSEKTENRVSPRRHGGCDEKNHVWWGRGVVRIESDQIYKGSAPDSPLSPCAGGGPDSRGERPLEQPAPPARMVKGASSSDESFMAARRTMTWSDVSRGWSSTAVCFVLYPDLMDVEPVLHVQNARFGERMGQSDPARVGPAVDAPGGHSGQLLFGPAPLVHVVDGRLVNQRVRHRRR